MHLKKTHRADVQVVQAGHLQPLTEEMFLHTGLCLEDGQWNGSNGDKPQSHKCETKSFYFYKSHKVPVLHKHSETMLFGGDDNRRWFMMEQFNLQNKVSFGGMLCIHWTTCTVCYALSFNSIFFKIFFANSLFITPCASFIKSWVLFSPVLSVCKITRESLYD